MPDLYSSSSSSSTNTTAADNPPVILFDTQEKEEQVVLLLRRHWVTNLPWIALAILMFFAPWALKFFPLFDFLPANYQTMAGVIWYLLVIAFIYEQFLSWYFNVYIVTDERVIDYDFYNLLYKDVTDADLPKVQDVSVKMGGVAQVLFNYGDVFIETAGAIPNIEFDKVSNPTRVAKVIHELRDQLNKEPL